MQSVTLGITDGLPFTRFFSAILENKSGSPLMYSNFTVLKSGIACYPCTGSFAVSERDLGLAVHTS